MYLMCLCGAFLGVGPAVTDNVTYLRRRLDGAAVVKGLAEDGSQPPVQVLDFGFKVIVIIVKTLKGNEAWQ